VEDLGGGVNLEMVLIPQGSFTMGSPTSEVGRDSDEGPQRVVNVNKFVMGKYEVTQAQWIAVMGTNPSLIKGDNLPVERVTWDEAQEFCRRLNARLGVSGSTGYRLPTEAEWEYAARAGTTTPFAFGETINADIVNYYGLTFYDGAPVGIYRATTVNVGSLGVANGWGLYDMHGNVWEWCEDDYHSSYSGAPVNGSAWIDTPRAALRVFRGGGWNNLALGCRSAVRYRLTQGFRDDVVGFRLSRTLP
jgi:formylglycine-generating enzyme required for sulfatase activity